MTEQLDLFPGDLSDDSGIPPERLTALEAKFQSVWLHAERTGSAAAEAHAWQLAADITARTGEDRLSLLERLVPDDLDPPPHR